MALVHIRQAPAHASGHPEEDQLQRLMAFSSPFMLRRALICSRLLLVSTILVLLGTASSLAQTQVDSREVQASTAVLLDLSVSDLEPFVDGIMDVVMAANHVPGAVVAVVKDGEVLFSKGYGYADLETRQEVNPDSTLFRIGSTTKLFVWTAVMQLAEQGRLDLSADINSYLDFEIPQTFPEPVTLLNLMAHNAGFEDKVVGLFARDIAKMAPLDALLVSDMPARVRPPGQLSAYSNYGVALAGYIVERVSGQQLEDYLEQHIFTPLGMTHTTLRQPVPGALEPYLARGYSFQSGQYVQNPFTFVPLYPAGAVSASASDMARFMLSHLEQGAYDSQRILQEATAEEMHRTHFRHHPRVAGWAHGFAERFHGTMRTIGHTGGTNDFFTEFTLVPEHGLGLFASFNGTNGFIAQHQLVEAFWGRYFPLETAPVVPLPGSAERAAQVAGFYGTTRACVTTFCRAASIFPSVSLQANAAGVLIAQLPFVGVRRYAEVEPWVFRQVDGDDLIVVQRDDAGNAYMFTRNAVDRAYPRQAWFETIPFSISLAVGTVLVFLSALLGWPLLRLVGRENPTRTATWTRGFATLTSLMFLVVLVMTMLALGNTGEVVFGITPLLQLSLTLAKVAALLTLGLLVLLVPVWRGGYWSVWGRLRYSLVVLAAVAMTWWMWYWKVLSI